MISDTNSERSPAPAIDATPDLDAFAALVEDATAIAEYPHADRVEQNAVVYVAQQLRAALTADPDTETVIKAEMARALSSGPGIIVIAGAVDADIVEAANRAFFAIINAEKEQGHDTGDHFAKPGANDRVWNALEKLAVAEPEIFVDYYRNDMIALAARAWLGPGYQITSQVNVVNPGGEAQMPHRDYHLGFMTNERAAQYPLHTHTLSPALTLQGAIAHCDMPVESGPTMYLPFSQRYELGYLAWRRPEFIDYFSEHHVQLPLGVGDAVFFNPALFHGAGTNFTADIARIANLLQINSSLGRVMETVDNIRVVNATYPTMLEHHGSTMTPPTNDELGGWNQTFEDLVAATADGYAFPTNLDRDPPVGGLTPPSQADIVRHALRSHTPPGELGELLRRHAERRRTH